MPYDPRGPQLHNHGSRLKKYTAIAKANLLNLVVVMPRSTWRAMMMPTSVSVRTERRISS